MALLACERGNLAMQFLDVTKIQGIMAAEELAVKKSERAVWWNTLVRN